MLLAHLTRRPACLLLLAVIFALRLPGMLVGVVDLDEIEFLLMGRSLVLGWVPYVDLVETKPLLAYVFYAPTGLFGFNLLPMQLIAVLWIFATALVTGRAARAWTGNAEIGAVASWLCGLASTCNLLSVNAEQMMNLPLAGALLFWIRSEARQRSTDALAAGLCVGVASLFKHQAGIALLALGIATMWGSLRGGRGVGRLLALGAGFALPWVLVALGYAAAGHWQAFYEWNVVRNFLYVGHGAGSALGRLGIALAVCVLGGSLIQWVFATRKSLERDGDGIRRGLALVLWSTWIPVSLGGRFYAHYFLQFVPPLALLAAPGITSALARWRELSRLARTGLFAFLLLPGPGFVIWEATYGSLGLYVGQDPRILELGGWLRRNTPPGSRLFIWGHSAPIYYFAQRLPGTRYKNAVFQTGDFDPQHIPAGFDLRPYLSRRDLDATLEDFARRRPDYVVDTAPCDIHSWSKVPLSLFPELCRVLEERYQLVASPAGCPVFKRR